MSGKIPAQERYDIVLTTPVGSLKRQRRSIICRNITKVCNTGPLIAIVYPAAILSMNMMKDHFSIQLWLYTMRLFLTLPYSCVIKVQTSGLNN